MATGSFKITKFNFDDGLVKLYEDNDPEPLIQLPIWIFDQIVEARFGVTIPEEFKQ